VSGSRISGCHQQYWCTLPTNSHHFETPLQVEHDGSTGTSSASRFLGSTTGKHQWFSGANCVEERYDLSVQKKPRWWFQPFFFQKPTLLASTEHFQKIPILTSMFFRWVGSTTNKFIKFIHVDGAMWRITMFVFFS